MDQDAQGRRNDGCKGLNSNKACRETHTLGAERKPSRMENRKAGEKYQEGRGWQEGGEGEFQSFWERGRWDQRPTGERVKFSAPMEMTKRRLPRSLLEGFS